MVLYCYIVETGYGPDDIESHILGHAKKYSQEEFDNICIEITEKHGDVEEVEHFVPYDKTNVEEIVYKIDGYDLIEYLVNDYGFIELNLPYNSGYQVKEISRTPVPKENLVMHVTKPTNKCPYCENIKPKKGDYCGVDCIHYISDYEHRYDSEGEIYTEDISDCALGHSEILDGEFCKDYEDGYSSSERPNKKGFIGNGRFA